MAQDTTTDSKTGFFDKVLGDIQVNTAVTIDRLAILEIGSTLFIAGFLILLTWYAFKKLLT